MKGEIRENKITKEWVIFAPARDKRPHDYKKDASAKRDRPEHSVTCPFCVGNEHMLASVLYETPPLNGYPWQTRVVPNIYPVLTPDSSIERHARGIYIAMGGYGHHEVVIDTPVHNQDIGHMDQAHVRSLIETYHHRYQEHYRDERNVLILIFRNHGPRAGASLEHPHSQIVTAGIMPRQVRWRNFEAQRYHDEWGRCVYCDILAYELEAKERIVFESSHFVAFVPYAADVPFETWIVPRRHHASFGTITTDEMDDLALVMKWVIGRLSERLIDPDYNYVIYSSPRYGNAPQLHWYVRIRPRLVTRAGFEIGTGMRINPSLPERDAAFLRQDAE